MSPKRILIPIIGFGVAGGYRVLSELASRWVDAGHTVDFLVHHQMAAPYFPTKAGIKVFNIHGCLVSESVDAAPHHGKPGVIAIYLGMLRGLRKIAAGYDVILANHSLTTLPVAAAKAGRARKFYYVQAYEPEYYQLRGGWKSKVLGSLSALSYRLPLNQIANAPIYIGYKGVRARHWVPPGVDRDLFFRRADTPSFAQGLPWTIGVIGRHEPSKGVKYVLEAFEEYARIDPHVRLKIAFGNLPAGWRHDRAEVVVPSNDHELANYYRAVDVLVAPGTVQLGACHYPVLEAMACGTPVITTGYLPADPINSWIVPVHDAKAIVEAFKDVSTLSTHKLQVKLDEAAQAVGRFYWESVAEEFMQLFA
ncbi:hypothetical protein GCM10010872_20140 [Dyella flava]|nr:hypothetical protein GCM10010872_20140 [Dyella flava]